MSSSLLARYEAAERLLPHRWKELVFSAGVKPHWIGGSDRFWYANRTRAGTELVLVDPEAGTRRPIDHEELTAVLGFAPATEPDPSRFFESTSPDGRWTVLVRDHNLVVRERATGAERQLTHDGAEGYSFGTPNDVSKERFTLEPLGVQMPPLVCWSPDSRRLVTHRIDERSVPLMHYVQSSPPDAGRPRLYSQHYAMVGEEALPTAELIVVDVETAQLTWADGPPIVAHYWSPIMRRQLWWGRDGTSVHFLTGERDDSTRRLYALDPDTGAVRVLVEESSDTQVQHHPLEFAPPNVDVLTTGETIWWSDRSGWGHLYLYAPDGSVRSLTGGEWLVRDLVAVDEAARAVVFSAAGREAGLDPYVRQLYRVGLDDGAIERLTHDALDHAAIGSPSGRYLVDAGSWIDVPEQSWVRDGSGAVVVELEQADTELLHEAGWRPPERFTVKAADGTTDLYGLLYRPGGFDPSARYPVLDDIYPGPQIVAGTVRFCEHGIAEHAASMAALGFAVVVVDARGTPLRSKSFQEHCRGPRDAENLDDHVSAIRQLAASRPWLDLERVGIYGHSGGGRTSTQAMLRHPDFFRVAVSTAGNHDDRLNHPSWSEKYIGRLGEADYEAHANPPAAHRLQGKLLLIHGELDDNVHLPQTLRLVDALMAANKDFDLLVVPNADHGLQVHQAYWLRRRWDYFVTHLLGEEPPPYRIADIAIGIEKLADFYGDWFAESIGV